MNADNHRGLGDEILGGLLAFPADARRVPDLREDHFLEDRQRGAFRAFKSVQGRDGDDAASSPRLVADEANLPETAMLDFLDKCNHRDIEPLVRGLIRHAELRDLAAQGQDLTRAAGEGDAAKAGEIVRRLHSPSGHSNGWTPVPLEPALDKIRSGEPLVQEPTILTTDVGRSVFYPATIAGIAASAESGKGILAARVIGDVLQAGGHAIYFDFEETVERRLARLVSMGIPERHLQGRFTYFQGNGSVGDPSRFDPYIRDETAVVVIDAVNPAMQAEGLSFLENDDVGAWFAGYPRYFQRKGLLVLLIDHVVKSKEDRGRGPIGGVQKLNEVDQQITLKVTEPLGRGKIGKVELNWTKDRLGFWGRGHHADMVVKSTGDAMTVTIEERADTTIEFRPTAKMEQVSKAVEEAPGITIRDLREQIGGRGTVTDDARRALVKDGYLKEEKQGRKTTLISVRPYREIGGTHNALCPEVGTRSGASDAPTVSEKAGHDQNPSQSQISPLSGNVSDRVPPCPGHDESECVPVSAPLKGRSGTRSLADNGNGGGEVR